MLRMPGHRRGAAGCPAVALAPDQVASCANLALTGQPGQHGNMVQRVVGTAGADADTPRETTPWSAIHSALAVTLAVLVLVQAVIAGQALFGGWAIDVHGWVGNGSFLLGLLLVALALRRDVGKGGTLVAVALVVAMFVQTGLGYAGRTMPEAASWHVPLGVAIFGLAVVHAAFLCVPATRAAQSVPDVAIAIAAGPPGPDSP